MVKKKKRSLEFIQDHTISWSINRLKDIRDSADDIFFSDLFSESEKKIIFSEYAAQIETILELLSPFEHEEENLVEWSNKFIVEYRDLFS